MKEITVVAAIIKHNDEILCVQRGENKFEYISNKFEFPGGKIESGETKEMALKRELFEELSITPIISKQFLKVDHTYPDFKIVMYSFICKVNSKELDLKEHISAVWLTVDELDKLDWAEADIPIVKKLIKNG